MKSVQRIRQQTFIFITMLDVPISEMDRQIECIITYGLPNGTFALMLAYSKGPGYGNIIEKVTDGQTLILATNRKSHMSFRLACLHFTFPLF